MSLNRRQFLTAGLFAAIYGPGLANASRGNFSSHMWRNWSGGQSSRPKARLAPKSEDELISALKTISGSIRPVGAGHSFSPLVPTDGTLVVLDNMRGLISSDKTRQTAVLGAGTRLGDAGPILEGLGQAMPNLPDIDRQTLAGALATSTHGTGMHLGSISKYVNSIRLITAKGEVLDLSAENDPELFAAAQVNIGALGLVTRIGFQNRSTFKLKSMMWMEETASVIASFDKRAEEYEHYEFLAFPHSDYSMVLAHKETDEPLKAPLPEEDPGNVFEDISKIPVALRRPIINSLLGDLEPTEAVELSHLALTNVRNDRFNEMEYSVPAELGLACIEEVLAVIDDQGLDVAMPLEFRICDADDTMLSMFSGGRRASISIHRVASEDYKPYFDIIEPIFWKYQGRPHWGKLHSLAYPQLRELYPRFDDFKAIQAQLDPNGQMLNSHLRQLLGL